jgi:molecular chaperone DnaK
MSADNVSLGEFNLDGLPPAPRGVPKIEVTFDIDSSGILNVAAKDTATGKSQSIRITGSTRLNEADKARMIKEAEQYAEADKKRREDVEKLNEADSACYQAEKMLADFADKLTDELKGRIQTAMRETKEAFARKDAAAASEKAEALKKLLKEAGAVIYAQTPSAGPYAETRIWRRAGGAVPALRGLAAARWWTPSLRKPRVICRSHRFAQIKPLNINKMSRVIDFESAPAVN